MSCAGCHLPLLTHKGFLSTKNQPLSLVLLTQVSHILCVSGGYSEPQCKQRSLMPFGLVDIHSGPMLISAWLGPFGFGHSIFLYQLPLPLSHTPL